MTYVNKHYSRMAFCVSKIVECYLEGRGDLLSGGFLCLKFSGLSGGGELIFGGDFNVCFKGATSRMAHLLKIGQFAIRLNLLHPQLSLFLFGLLLPLGVFLP